MSTHNPLVIGIFQRENEAMEVIEDLRRMGFNKDQFGIAQKGGTSETPNLLNELVNLGVPRDRANYYDGAYKSGRSVVSVRTDGRDQEVINIIGRHGGMTDIDNNTFTGTANDPMAGSMNAPSTQQSPYDQGTQQRTVPIREERLEATKEQVQSGEVYVHKDVVTEQQQINVPTMHEEVIIERRAVNDPRVSDTPIGEDETITIPVSEEQVNVYKRPVVTGEVDISKQTVQENQQVTDEVRREELRVDSKKNPDVRTDNDIHPNIDRDKR